MHKSLLSADESGFPEEITAAWDCYRLQDRAATSKYNSGIFCRRWKTRNLYRCQIVRFLRLSG